MKENIPTWHQDNWNANIHLFWVKICKIEKLAKIVFFRRSMDIESLNFFDFLESLLKLKENIPTSHQDNWNVII